MCCANRHRLLCDGHLCYYSSRGLTRFQLFGRDARENLTCSLHSHAKNRLLVLVSTSAAQLLIHDFVETRKERELRAQGNSHNRQPKPISTSEWCSPYSNCAVRKQVLVRMIVASIPTLSTNGQTDLSELLVSDPAESNATRTVRAALRRAASNSGIGNTTD
jgi:hypothetical protein